MADVNTNINVNIDTSDALAQLKSLQRQLSQFHTSVAKSSAAAASAQAGFQKNLINSINATGAFSAELRTVRTTSEAFSDSLEKNKFSMREYFRYAGAATKTFGHLFKSEFDTIGKVAEDRVKKLQTQYIKLGRDTSGAMKAIAVIPSQLDLNDHATKLQLTAQRQAIFNQLLKQGSTNLLNFGKNTQWAGRQLMVGFTLPLASLGMTASKTFMEMETAAIKFKKVYGDLLTPKEETQKALKDIEDLGREFTKYGISVAQTVSIAAEAAAAGFQGLDLQRQTTEATRLSILGQLDAQKALETTISLQNAFKMSSEDLADSINFLNAVENQTVVSLDDITTAIPKVAPVIQQLGGDVKDLAFFLTAMKQGGINASEGANALKSGLAALINPTAKASAMLADMGINIKKIVESNQGDIKSTVIDFALALDKLDPLNRARAIEQLFGKFQFARLSTLFSNVISEGTQASRVLDLAGASIEDLSKVAESELGMTAESTMNKFKKAVEDLKVALVPVGEAFLNAVTPIVEFFGNIFEKFAGLSDSTKKIITVLTIAIGGIGPVALMAFGLLANGIANIVKLFGTLRNGYLRLTGQSQVLGEQTQYMTNEQLEAAAAAHSLNQTHANLTQTFTAETSAVRTLIAAYSDAVAASSRFALANPGMMIPGRRVVPPKLATGGILKGPGTGTSDSIPAMLSNGEAVIPAKNVQRFPSMVAGLITGNIPGYKRGNLSGLFGVSAAQAKEDIGLYKAPAAVKPQTVANTWSTMQAEIDAMTLAAEEYLREIGFSAEQIAAKIKQLVQKQASHITKQVEQIEIAGETVDVKQWNASNLVTDFGGMNNYLNSIHKVTETLDEQEISDIASNLNMSIDEFKRELKALSDGIHPTTRQGGQVLGAIARRGASSTDKTLAYQSRAVAAGMDVRLSGDFYETVPSRAYDATRDIKSLEQVAVKVDKLKAKILDSFNISDEVARLSGVNVTALRSAWSQLSVEAKTRLVALSGDVNAFTAALMQEAKQAGIAGFAVGKAATDGIAKGARTRSPSRDTIITGEDIGKGLEIGMQSRLDDVARTGETLGTTATQSVRRAAYRGQGPAPIGVDPLAGATMLPIVSQPTRRDLRRTAVRDRFRSIRGRVAGTFGGARGMGVSSGLMIGSQFLPGKAGEVAGKASGVAFALQALTMLPGPLKLFAVGVGAAAVAAKGLAFVQERQRLAVEGLGDVAKLTSKKLESLGNFFGVAAKQLPYEIARSSAGKLAPLGAKQRSQVDLLRADTAFQEGFKNDIAALRGATRAQATMVLNSLAIQLKGRGYASEQIKTIIQALQEEAGRTDLNLNFKNIGIATEKKIAQQARVIAKSVEAIAGAQELVAGTGNNLFVRTGPAVNDLKLATNEMKEALNAAASSMFGNMQGIIGQFQAGELSAADLSSQINIMSQEISSIPKADAAVLLDRMFMNLGSEARNAVIGIKGVNQQLKIMLAISAGILTPDDRLLKILSTATDDKVLGRAQAQISKKLGSFFKEFETNTIADATDDTNDYSGATDGLSAASKKYIEILKKEIDALKDKRDAQKDANYELERQIELQLKQQELTNRMKQEQISGNYLEAAFLGQQKRKNVLEFNQQTIEIRMDKVIEKMEKRLAEIEDGATLKPAEVKKLKKADGGYINNYMGGGKVSGPGTSRSDSIPAYLSNGEYVIKASSVNKYGKGFMDHLNAGRFADGGSVNPITKGFRFFKNAMNNGSNPASGMLMEVLNQAGYLGQTGLSSITKGIIPKPTKKQDKAFQEFTGVPGAYRAITGKSSEGPMAQDSLAAQKVLDWSALAAFAIPGARGAAGKVPVSSITKVPKTVGKIVTLPKTRKAEVLLKQEEAKARAAEEALKTAQALEFLKNNPRPVRPGAPGAPPAPAKSLWDESIDEIMASTPWVDEVASSATKPSRIKDILSTVGTTVARPVTTPARFVSRISGMIGRAWTYGRNPNIRWTGGLDWLGRDSLFNEVINRGIGSLATKFNPKLTVKSKMAALDPREPAINAYSTLQRYMSSPDGRGGVFGLEYKNIPKNILQNFVKNPIKKVSELKDLGLETISQIRDQRALSSSNPFVKNVAMALYDKQQRMHYTIQAVVDSLPGGFEGLLQLLRGVHRSFEPYTGQIKSPLERVLEARIGKGKFPTNAFGPGNYFATSDVMSTRFFREFGNFKYKTSLTPRAILRVLRSKGFATKDEVAAVAKKYNMEGTTLESIQSNADHPLVQALIDEGYLGYRHNDAFTNWMMGVMPGMGFKLMGKKRPGVPKRVTKKASGGLIKGPGTGISDSIRATLGYADGGSIRVSDGEFIVKASSVKDYGVAAMNAVNNGTATIGTNSGGTVYNVNMTINGENSNPREIAEEVMKRMQVLTAKNNKMNVGLR